MKISRKVSKYLQALVLKNFTVFEELSVDFTRGINIFIGKNGTGKTHLLKILYSACDIVKTGDSFPQKLSRVFLPLDYHLGRLVKRSQGSTNSSIKIRGFGNETYLNFSNHVKRDYSKLDWSLGSNWQQYSIKCAYIPVKEMLANAPGFRALYAEREIYYEEIYEDIIDRAFLPKLKGRIDEQREKLVTIIKQCIHGKVVQRQEIFYLQNKQGKLEFTLLAEGMRKLALLWLLIQNGTLLQGSILFWDEPEANLNPSMLGTVVDILLELQRIGVQIFLATHDYVLLKEFDQRTQKNDSVRYHSLYFGEDTSSVHCSSTDHYLEIDPNAISETFQNLFTQEVKRALTGKGKEDG